MITCECGGKFQRRGRNKHAMTKMHRDSLIYDCNPEVEILRAENLQRKTKKENARLDAEKKKSQQELRDNNAEVETWRSELKGGKIWGFPKGSPYRIPYINL